MGCCVWEGVNFFSGLFSFFFVVVVVVWGIVSDFLLFQLFGGLVEGFFDSFGFLGGFLCLFWGVLCVCLGSFYG